MFSITVYTPTHNRAHLISKCYYSLTRQTCKDFEWLIVDDGSTDNTSELIQGWIAESVIPIRYIRQDHQGVHIARNTACQNINSELCMCIDSDDYLTDDAIEKILDKWNQKDSNNYCGIIALDMYEDGKLLTQKFPENLEYDTFHSLRAEKNFSGDVKLIGRTDIEKKFPYPQFKGEKYYPVGYRYLQMEKQYPFLLLNEPVCIVEYQDNGISASRLKLFYKAPKGYMHYRKFVMEISFNVREKYRHAIHYVAESLLCKKKYFIRESGFPLIVSAALIPGYMLMHYIKKANKK